MAKELWRTELDVTPWRDAFTTMFEAFFETRLDSETGVVYDSPYEPEAMALADHAVEGFRHKDPASFELPEGYARPELGSWPTPEEVAASAPCVNGWYTPIENAASRGAMLLGGLARGAFNLDEKRRRECIARLFRGLVGLWDAPGRTGFVCRGFLPQSRAFYRQTSHDQAPLYLIGLATYADTPYCPPADRALVVEICQSVMHWLEAGGWRTRLYDDDAPTPHSDLRGSNDPGITAKALALAALAHRVTGDAHWREVYLAWRDEDGRRRFGYMARRDKTWQVYDPWQISLAYRLLADYDEDEDCRAFYDEQRRLFLHTLAYFCRHPLPPRAPLADSPPPPQPLPDWRPALARTVRDVGFKPNDGVFWYQVGTNLREGSSTAPPTAADFDAALSDHYACIFGAYRLIMADWPDGRSNWGAADIRARLEETFTRADPRRIPHSLPLLAFALGQ